MKKKNLPFQEGNNTHRYLLKQEELSLTLCMIFLEIEPMLVVNSTRPTSALCVYQFSYLPSAIASKTFTDRLISHGSSQLLQS